MKRSTIHYIEL